MVGSNGSRAKRAIENQGGMRRRHGNPLTNYNKGVIMPMMPTSKRNAPNPPTEWRIVLYKDANDREPIKVWLAGLSVKEEARVNRAIHLLKQYGTQLAMPYARHLRGKLWELRISAGREDYRVLYAAVIERTFVLLHAFSKKTDKTPAREIETAERRLTDYLKGEQTDGK